MSPDTPIRRAVYTAAMMLRRAMLITPEFFQPRFAMSRYATAMPDSA